MGRTARSRVDKALDAYAELTADERTIFAAVLERTMPIGAQTVKLERIATTPRRKPAPKPKPEVPGV